MTQNRDPRAASNTPATNETFRENEELRRQIAELRERLDAERPTLQGFISMSPYAIQILDSEGRHQFANDAFRKMFGGEPPAGWPVFEDPQVIAGAGADNVRRLRAGEVMRMGSDVPYNAARSLPDDPEHAPDRELWLKTVAFPTFDENGKIAQFVVMHEDLTERKRAEHSRLAAERRFRALIDKSSDLTAILAADGAALYVSPSIEAVLGWNPADALGKQALALAHPDDRAAVDRARAACLAATSGEPVLVQPRIRRKNGSYRLLECTARNLLHDEDVRGIVLNARDITEREAARAEQRAVENRLRQAERLEALGALAGGIAHDFNTVLAIIQGFAEETQEEVAARSEIANNQEQILTAVKRARRLVEQILLFSRAEVDKEKERKPVQMHRIVNETLNMLANYLPRSVKVVRQLDSAAGAVLADPSEIQQIVINLCTNAHDAMEDGGGVLTIALDPVEARAEGGAGLPASLEPGFYCRLTVGDTGCGIDEATAARIFEPFFTTKPVGKGTGMGLSVVHGILAARGGAVTVESRVGEGSTFRVFLPVTTDLAGEEDAPAETELPGGTERVLLVDDEPQAAAVYRAILERLGYSVTCFTSSVRALNAFLKNLRAFDVLVTDQSMPKLTGLALAHRVRERRPDLPIVITSAYEKKTTLDELTQIPGVRFLRKPFSKRALATAIRGILDAADRATGAEEETTWPTSS